ncbi:potassium-transporting ATPase subunit KdpC [Streptomyces durbertensis]|uniref:Potassium-transporting ATPase KdpC subunit n=1 Tax=Streptomyces durbertensis TaxID=2448886 RepID=A0ABR6EMI6_9ACTN|nr:potassium-transporting ATPase subunit KdpC [Streptomyces durbertensis]MBB1246120.1 potassium-transporting ATPase subunit KdpC [Streptomyces durbertensis]
MNASLRAPLRVLGAALRALLVLTVVTGVLYPLAVTAVAQTVFRDRANGQLVERDGKVVGSTLIGQTWNLPNGSPDPRWFQGRPSASDYDGMDSGASNLAADNRELVREVGERRAAVAGFNGVPESEVPADAVTASASGLDPHVSPEYARLQVARVARERGLPQAAVRRLVGEHTAGRPGGFLGEPTVNVLRLNLALDRLGDR